MADKLHLRHKYRHLRQRTRAVPGLYPDLCTQPLQAYPDGTPCYPSLPGLPEFTPIRHGVNLGTAWVHHLYPGLAGVNLGTPGYARVMHGYNLGKGGRIHSALKLHGVASGLCGTLSETMAHNRADAISGRRNFLNNHYLLYTTKPGDENPVDVATFSPALPHAVHVFADGNVLKAPIDDYLSHLMPGVVSWTGAVLEEVTLQHQRPCCLFGSVLSVPSCKHTQPLPPPLCTTMAWYHATHAQPRIAALIAGEAGDTPGGLLPWPWPSGPVPWPAALRVPQRLSLLQHATGGARVLHGWLHILGHIPTAVHRAPQARLQGGGQGLGPGPRPEAAQVDRGTGC